MHTQVFSKLLKHLLGKKGKMEKEMEKVQNRQAALALELNMLGRTYGGQVLVGKRDNNFSFE